MRSKGKLTSWNDEKGFGFITPNDGGGRVFVHVRAFANRNRRPGVGAVVTYELRSDRQGRTRAENATLAGDRLLPARKRGGGLLAFVGAAVFLLLLGGSVVRSATPPLVPIFYAVLSLVTFLVYWADKSAARTGDWRTPENTLHLLSLFGGWPGALVGQQVLRHKSKKASFRAVFWVTVLLNCTGLVWLHTQNGAVAYAQWSHLLPSGLR